MGDEPDSSATQLRSVIDRILRLKEEQDALSADVRDIYAEAKSNGFDKTALGLVVSQLRKRAKDPDKYAELSEVASVYLAAYETGTAIAPRAHAHVPRTIGAIDADNLSRQERPAGDEADTGGSDHQDQRRVLVPADQRLEQEGHNDPHSGGNEATAAGHSSGSGRAAAPEGVVLPLTAADLDIPTYLQRGHPDCTLGPAK